MTSPDGFRRWVSPLTSGSLQIPTTPLHSPAGGRHHILDSGEPRHVLHLQPSYKNVQFDYMHTPTQSPAPSASRKRKQAQALDENVPPLPLGDFSPSPFSSNLPEPAQKRTRSDETPQLKRKSPQTGAQKLDAILEKIQGVGWTLGDFLDWVFRARDAKGNEVHRPQMHSGMASAFLRGSCKYTVADIVSHWMTHPDGRISKDSSGFTLLYSTQTPYKDIRPARAALTSFAVQTARPSSE